MSKSLKNFTTIKDALKEVDANQLRWMFMLHNYKDSMDFSEHTVRQAKDFDSIINNFLNRIVHYPSQISDIMYNDKENQLFGYFLTTKNRILEELKLFHLETASLMIFELVGKTNSYIDLSTPNISLLRKIYHFILNLITLLGYQYQTNDGNSIENIMNVLITTRNELRSVAKDEMTPIEIKKQLFAILDRERNVLLPNVNIKLEDTKDGSLWSST